MKRIIALILVVFMTLTAVGCADENANSSANSESNQSNATEKLSNTNSISGDTNIGSGSISGCEVSPYVDFASVDEFVKTLKNGNFSGRTLDMVKRFEEDKYGRIKICNPNKIYEPTAPNNFSLSSITWEGETYSYNMSGPEDSHAWIYLHEKESFERNFKDEWSSRFMSDTTSDEGYTQTYFSTFAGEFKRKRYKLETNVATYEKASNKTEVYIVEYYRLKTIYSDFPTSSEIPYRIYMFVQNSGLQYEVRINDLNSPVTPEWLLQFGLKPRS